MIRQVTGGPQFVGNSSAPQFADYGKAIGYGLILACCLKSTNTGFAQEYQHGTHATAIYAAEGIKSRITPSVKGGVPVNAVKVTYAAPQAYDFTLPAQLFTPIVNQQAGAVGSQYTFGTHAQAMADSQNRSSVFPSVRTPPGVTTIRPLQTIVVPPQVYDFTLPPTRPFVPVAQGWISTQIGAGPQLADLTLPPSVQKSVIHLTLAPWNPTTIVSKSQDDPTQLPAKVFRPPLVTPAYLSPKPFFASQADPTQIPARIFASVARPPTLYVPPVMVQVGQQAYSDLAYQRQIAPLIGIVIPPPAPGFRVMAVTAGFYGRFRTPGDVFDIAFAADYSDSTVNYQDQPSYLVLQGGGFLLLQGGGQLTLQAPTEGSTSGYGWMMRVAQTTPIFDWLQSNGAPYLPPQDPRRRFIY